MIKFENTDVMNFDGAFRGLRNPLNSWSKSDSGFKYKYLGDCKPTFKIGENDLKLARRLIKAGSDHRKFMRQILVSVDITAPLYWWKEFDTYKVGTVANSCSTMHKIHDKAFTLDDFSHEHLGDTWDEEDENWYEHSNSVVYYGGEYGNTPKDILEFIVEALNHYRKMFLETKNKYYWWQLIQLLPSSYNQKRTVTLNYEVLYNIYGSRKGHKLDEWRVGFIEWIESLPYANELIVDRG